MSAISNTVQSSGGGAVLPIIIFSETGREDQRSSPSLTEPGTGFGPQAELLLQFMPFLPTGAPHV